ncbi:MAG TPA: phospholipase D-like domain-containing protein [Beijerinckiaceae bacterium]|nr:phospholipase D-like domain-containing protein [Beijerinckiaceae bacterium]
MRIVSPGRNCWRVVEARRAAVLIDGGPYFAHLEDALRQARRSILIIGWDFDGRIRLRPDVDPETSPPLGQLLRSLVEARPELEIRILVWSVAVIHAPGAPLPLLFGADWQEHPRIHVKLDTHHPKYAAHHQKIVCIDEALAFVGGIDLTVRRWDRQSHLARDPARLSPEGEPYNPVHDIQMVVDGAAARAMCSLGRSRWRNATGEELGDCQPNEGLWPSALAPQFSHAPVAVARTQPAWCDAPAVMEAAVLTTDALRAAQRMIYIEAQYMTAPYVGDVLAESLARKTGPEVIVLMTHQSRGLLERLIMGRNRARLIRRLKRADRFNRLRVYYPVVPGSDGEQQVMVHSKLIIVDDLFIRVGSSNLNNRSVGLDTECDLAVEATTDTARAAIASILRQLVAEHIDADPAMVAEAIAATGSVIGAIERLNTRPRGLRLFEAMTEAGPAWPVFGTGLLDPEQPFAPFRFLRRGKRSKRAAASA